MSRRPPWGALTRGLLVAGAVAAVPLAAQVPVSIGSLPRAQPVRTEVAAQGQAERTLTCPGNEVQGLTGVADFTVSGALRATTAPAEVSAPAAPVPSGGQGAVVTVVRGTGEAQPIGGPPASLPLVSDPSFVTAQGPSATSLTARQWWTVSERGLLGLASATCVEPVSDSWLTAGGPGPGQLERLIIVNPSENVVSATIDVLGPKGRLEAAHTTVPVPPRSRVVRLVEALAPGADPLVIRVQSTGGGLASWVNETGTAGTTSLGTETVPPLGQPSTTQTVLGVTAGPAPVVRVAVPGPTPAVISVRVTGEKGRMPVRDPDVVTVGAGAVAEIPVPGLRPGRYAVEVTADEPIVAAALSSVTVQKAADRAWSVPTAALSRAAGAVLSGRGSAVLHLLSPTATSVRVWTVAEGAPRSEDVRLVAGHLTTRNVTGDAVWVAPDQPGLVRAVVEESRSDRPALTTAVLVEVADAGGRVTAVHDPTS